MIALIDRLAAFAAREAENESPEEKKRGEEEAAKRLAERVKGARKGQGSDQNGGSPVKPRQADGDVWASTQIDKEENGTGEVGGDIPPTPDGTEPSGSVNDDGDLEEKAKTSGDEAGVISPTGTDKGKGKAEDQEVPGVTKFRGIPQDVRLFEVFWHQVVELIKVRGCALESTAKQLSLSRGFFL